MTVNAWFIDNDTGRTNEVGSLEAIGGFYDLWGNVDEWTVLGKPTQDNESSKVGFIGGNATDSLDTLVMTKFQETKAKERFRWRGFRFIYYQEIR